MAKIIRFGKDVEITKKETDLNQNDSCKFFDFDNHYADKLLYQATMKLKKNKDYQALLDINKSNDIKLRNNIKDLNLGLLGIFHLNARNFELATMYLYKTIAMSTTFPTLMVMYLSVCFELNKKYDASTFLKNLIFEYDQTLSLPAFVHMYNIMSSEIKERINRLAESIKNVYSIESVKKSVYNDVLNRCNCELKEELGVLWELDKSDIFTNYWYHNYNGIDLKNMNYIPFKYIIQKCEQIDKAILSDEFMVKVCTMEDSDCLFNILITYCTVPVVKKFVQKAIELNIGKLLFYFENFLFSSTNDSIKLELFLMCVKNNYKIGNSLNFRYKDYLVTLNYFDYKQLYGINNKVADAFIFAIKQLILDGNYNIDFSAKFVNKILDDVTNIGKDKELTIAVIKDMILNEYYFG